MFIFDDQKSIAPRYYDDIIVDIIAIETLINNYIIMASLKDLDKAIKDSNGMISQLLADYYYSFLEQYKGIALCYNDKVRWLREFMYTFTYLINDDLERLNLVSFDTFTNRYLNEYTNSLNQSIANQQDTLTNNEDDSRHYDYPQYTDLTVNNNDDNATTFRDTDVFSEKVGRLTTDDKSHIINHKILNPKPYEAFAKYIKAYSSIKNKEYDLDAFFNFTNYKLGDNAYA